MTKDLILNNFFAFLFKEDIFDYWNVDIPTARKIGKSKAMALMMVYWISQQQDWAGMAMRDTSSNLDSSVLAEIFWALRELNVKASYSLSRRELTFPNGNKIYFRGAQVQNQTQVTLAGFTSSYTPKRWIVWLEEVYQFSAKQFAEIGQAIRGAPKTIFATSNPWLETNWYVKMISEIQPFDEIKLKKDHAQIGSYVNEQQRRLVVYSSVHNTPFLSPQDIAQLRNDTLAQPWQEKPVLWGMPGILTGAIYAHLLDKVNYKPPLPASRVIEWTVGIDFGEIKDSTSLVLIATMSNFEQVRVVEEKEYKPHGANSLERNELAELVHDTITGWMAKYEIKKVQARYDNAAVVFGKRLKELSLDSPVNYKSCSKKLILDRIDLTTMLMAEGRLIFKDNIRKLRLEMKASIWKSTNKEGEVKYEREDGNDHMLNAFEYALERRHQKYHRIARPAPKIENKVNEF